LCALFLAQGTYAGECLDMSKYTEGSGVVITVEESTLTGGDQNVCPHLVGKEVCCTDQQFDDIETWWEYAQDVVDATVEALENAEIPEATDDGGVANDGSVVAEEAKKLSDRLDTLFRQFIKKMPKNVEKCAYGSLTFAAGLMCVACDANSATYAVQESYGTISITLAQETCTNLVSDCTDLYISFHKLLEDIIAAVNDFVNAIEGEVDDFTFAILQLWAESSEALVVDPCGGNSCEEEICYDDLGIVLYMPNAAFAGDLQKRAATILADLQAGTFSEKEGFNGEEYIRSLYPKDELKNVELMEKRVLTAPKNERQTDNLGKSYSDDANAYPAYNRGSETSMGKSLSSAGVVKTSGIVAAFAAFVALFALIV